MVDGSQQLLVAVCLAVVGFIALVRASGPYGLAKTPPMGWRSWNCYGANVNQNLMQTIMDKMVQRNRTVDGVPTSLLDLGYSDVGLDDNWQACGAGVEGSFFDANGYPLVNTAIFPDMKGMVQYAHARGLRAGFYMNNCICRVSGLTNATLIDLIYRSSVNYLLENEFDSVKLDACSQFKNTSYWAELLNISGKPMMMENCWNSNPPHSVDQWGGEFPYNWFRTSGDISPTWGSIFTNLQTTAHYQSDPPLSHPGCWAYPDMLEVGNLDTYLEDRSHFGAWCIVSSPLILGLDLTDEDRVSAVWDIITNKEAIAVNQDWAGSPGRLVTVINATVTPTLVPAFGDAAYPMLCNKNMPEQQGWQYNATTGQVVAPGGLCLDSSHTSQLLLTPCNAAVSSQQFNFDSRFPLFSPIVSRSNPSSCVDTYDSNQDGPAVQMSQCRATTNQEFRLLGPAMQAENGLCLAALASPPMPPASQIAAEIWGKPLSHGAYAVLALSNTDPATSANHTLTLTFADFGLTGPIRVRSIWDHTTLGTFTTSFTTDAFGGHDSRFYMLSPV